MAGVYERGAVQFFRAWGLDARGGDTLRTDAGFAFPGLTEALVAVTIRALAAAGQLDVHAPLGTFLRDVPQALSAVTLDQLLGHRAGLDDAEPPPGLSWDELLADMPARSVFLPPGAIRSESRYSYPLAARALERAAGLPLTDVLRTAVLEPLGMTSSGFELAKAGPRLVQGYAMSRTADSPFVEAPVPTVERGIPVLYTTAEDVLTLGAALVEGRVPGFPPPPAGAYDGASSRPVDGFRVERSGGTARLTLTGRTRGFHAVLVLWPDLDVALSVWANGVGPAVPGTLEELEAAVAAAYGLEEKASRPDEGVLPTEAVDPEVWAGDYLNGDRLVRLVARGGRLFWFDGYRELEVDPLAGGEFGAYRHDEGRRLALRFRLERVGERRVVVHRGRAYLTAEVAQAIR